MRISYDYEDLFKILNKYRVKYLVAGAYAVSYYAEPRFTKDIDIWVDPKPSNAQRVYNALKAFGAPLRGITPKDFTNKKIIYQIGVPPLRVDIMMGLPGLTFAKAWEKRKKTKYNKTSIYILSKQDLIVSKEQIKRDQDILDIKNLKKQRR